MLVSTINSRELEASRASKLLHDEVGQVLSAVGLQLDVVKLDFKERLPEIVGRTNEIQQMLEMAVQQVRALSYALNPAIVERAGLYSALDRLVGRLRDRHPGSIRYVFDSTVRVPTTVGNAWYKIAELALANAIQHSGADRIEVLVKRTAKSNVLEVRDSGKGFDLQNARAECPGLGLLLIEHYAAQVPVPVEIKSGPGNGTIVRSKMVLTEEEGRMR